MNRTAPDLASLRSAEGAAAKAVLAKALGGLEAKPDGEDSLTLLDEAFADPQGQVIGITGPPGVGKSTLLATLISRYRSVGFRVAVIAVDPSSRLSGGALLGDRMRLRPDPMDHDLFIRSMAARDRMGGLADLTIAAAVLMRALYDRVLVETVGVGQSETDVSELADTVLFCVQPASGDSLQFLKAGIMDIPDLIAVTKADLGRPAARAAADLAEALATQGRSRTPVLTVSSKETDGIEELVGALEAHHQALGDSGELLQKRSQQAGAWFKSAMIDRFGKEGWRACSMQDKPAGNPFRLLAEESKKMRKRLFCQPY